MSILLMLTLIPFRVDAKGQFKDVSDKHWAQEEIDYLTSKQFINGFPDGSFKPNDRMNRADVAVVIAKVLQLELDRASDINFKMYRITTMRKMRLQQLQKRNYSRI